MIRLVHLLLLSITFSACGINKPHLSVSSDECSSKNLARIYFGANTPDGVVSESQWQTFVRDEITAKFPSGLTVLEAHGQWLGANGVIEREASRIVELVNDNPTKDSQKIDQIIAKYKDQFKQEAVLVVQLPVIACLQ